MAVEPGPHRGDVVARRLGEVRLAPPQDLRAFAQTTRQHAASGGAMMAQSALAAAGRLTDARVAQAGVALPVAGLYPSLHLNLSECYRKLGDLDRAREHLREARATVGALGDDEYGLLIKQGMARIAEQLGTLGSFH